MRKIHNLEKRKEYLEYFYLFGLLYITCGFTMNKFVGWFTMGMLFCLSGLVLSFRLSKIRLDRNTIIIFLIIVMNFLITSIYNQDHKNFLIELAEILSALLFVSIIPFRDFTKIFTKVMYFLAAYSLAAYMIALIVPQLLSIFPDTYNISGVHAFNLGFAVMRYDPYLIRSDGIFWEPGAYQTFLNMALILYFFVMQKREWKPIFIITLTIITTYSTTGYICMSLIYMTYFGWQVFDKEKKSDKKLKLFFAFCVLITVFMIVYQLLPSNTKYQLFGKIFNPVGNTNEMTSTSVRIDAAKYAVEAFMTSPFLGLSRAGFQDFAEQRALTMITCTPLNWFAVYGIVMGLICNLGLYLFAKKCFPKGRLIPFFLWVIVILLIISEDYSRNPSILIFVLYGYAFIGKQMMISSEETPEDFNTNRMI